MQVHIGELLSRKEVGMAGQRLVITVLEDAYVPKKLRPKGENTTEGGESVQELECWEEFCNPDKPAGW
jgi:hypothetical protein